MDLAFIHPFLSPYDFNSDLEGCYKSENKLTAALFLKQDDVKHTVCVSVIKLRFC